MSVYFDEYNKKLCCGCRGCEQVCPVDAIQMIEDVEGFLYPHIDKDMCINCEKCKVVCPIKDGGYKNSSAYVVPKVYGGYNKKEEILKNSTSGGLFTAIVESIYTNDEINVCGAHYDENLTVKHVLVNNKKLLSSLRGSKYVQSDIGSSYFVIKELLKTGQQVIFSGTPCQVAGLKAFLEKDYDNLLCIDIVCQGVYLRCIKTI